MRRGHRRPAQVLVAPARPGGVDVHAGRAEVDGAPADVREERAIVGVVGRRHGDHVRYVVRRGIRRRRVVVGPVVPCSGDEERVVLVGDVDRIGERLRVDVVRPRVVHDVGAVLRRVEDGADRVRIGPGALRVQELDRHDPHVPVDAGDADAVVAGRADRARDMRSVPVVVRRVVVVVRKVPPVPVVEEAVVVVVDTVVATTAAVLAGVDPDLRAQIGMRPVDAGVDHRDRHVRAARGDVPRLGRIDVGVGSAAGAVDRLARVVQSPRIAERRIVRQRVDRDHGVRLGVAHARVLAQRRDRGVDVARREVRERAVDLLPALLLVGPDALQDLLLLGGGDVALKSDEHVARHRL